MNTKQVKPYKIRRKQLILSLIPIVFILLSLLLKKYAISAIPCIICYSLLLPLGKQYKDALKDYVLNPEYQILTEYQTKNDCYKMRKILEEPVGIVIHCTDDDTPYLKRYVDVTSTLGYNEKENTWNNAGISKMFHSFIGYDKNDKLSICNTLSYSMCCRACGKGDKGSYDDTAPHLQFAICGNIKQSKQYFEKAVFGAAVQYCAYICVTHNIPYESIISDKEAYERGYSASYSEFNEWLSINGKTMDDFRCAVKDRLKGK